MARPPEIRILSPFDPRFQSQKVTPDVIPSPIVKALISGLLSHLWSGERRKTKEMGISQDEAEKMLWSHVVLATEYGQNRSENDLATAVKKIVPFVFASLTGHSYLLFAGQSDWIISQLEKSPADWIVPHPMKTQKTYVSLPGHADRLAWMKKHLPHLLHTLKQYKPCHECRMKTDLPPDDVLNLWADNTNAGELRDILLAWFHCDMSAGTIKRILATKPSVPTV